MEHAAVAIVRVSKYTGQMAYAVRSFGGFLGIVPSITRSPWRSLAYEEQVGGYVIDPDREQLEKAPRFSEKTRNPTGRIARTPRIEEYWDDPTVIIRGQPCQPDAWS